MTAKPKFRWYQFSLLALLTVVTLVAAILGGRIEYLWRRAVFHEREATKIETGDFDLQAYLSHKHIARDLRAAMSRPWTFVDESPRPLPDIPATEPPGGMEFN